MTNQSVKQGIKIFKAGDKEKARLIFKEAIQTNPNDEMAWFWLAATYKKKSNQIKCLNKLLAINPHHQAAREQLARLLGKKLPPDCHKTTATTRNSGSASSAASFASARKDH